MPLIERSSYQPAGLFCHPHANTIYAALGRRVGAMAGRRERITTPDGDFLDLDWFGEAGNGHLVLVLHGLEGNSGRPYVQGMIRRFIAQGWNGAGLNFRGCSGEPNRRLRSYHMGETSDLAFVLHHLRRQRRFRSLSLIGFSLGGNVVLKFLGERGSHAQVLVDAAVAFSVPCDIPSANVEIHRWHNSLYLRRFMNSLNAKIREKARRFPEQLEARKPMPRNFREFDNRYTAPIHGFRDAIHYWTSCSSLNFIPGIRVPTLLVNSQDDTFLSEPCYPVGIARQLKDFYFEAPRRGGHVGFAGERPEGGFWSEYRALEFVRDVVGG